MLRGAASLSETGRVGGEEEECAGRGRLSRRELSRDFSEKATRRRGAFDRTHLVTAVPWDARSAKACAEPAGAARRGLRLLRLSRVKCLLRASRPGWLRSCQPRCSSFWRQPWLPRPALQQLVRWVMPRSWRRCSRRTPRSEQIRPHEEKAGDPRKNLAPKGSHAADF